ncbi:hypothetical protein AVEN_203831-1 [Araneus ventricosus]|uniref:Uncharacterized protein n=1 Tax=Araneus ventricosus TaxID=182803 RepID=A0A4Y2HX29_ARAVE|nr:hypothetical protein AVEN_203831-1 [Araneus ventricosus]
MSDDEFILLEEQRCVMSNKYENLSNEYWLFSRRNRKLENYYYYFETASLHSNDLPTFKSTLKLIRDRLDDAENILWEIASQLYRLEVFLSGTTIFSFQQFTITEKKVETFIQGLLPVLANIRKHFEKIESISLLDCTDRRSRL